MIDCIKKMVVKYRELIFYGIFGVGATLINIISFYVFKQMWGMKLITSNILAWTLAFIFAFITNKLWVFESKDWQSETAIKEMISFLITRLTTLVLDTLLLWFMVEYLQVNDLVSKITVNIVVIIVNYVASKFWVFRKKITK